MGIGNRVSRMVRKPAFGIAVLTPPVVLAGAVSAAPPDLPHAPVVGKEVIPLAAVSPQVDTSGVTVVALTKQPTNFHFAAATPAAPPPAIVVSSIGSLRIPAVPLAATAMPNRRCRWPRRAAG